MLGAYTLAKLAVGATFAGCPILPVHDAFNTDVSRAPVDPSSDAYIASIGLDAHLHPSFGTRYGIPITVTPADTPAVAVQFVAYPDESDPGPYPIPATARVEQDDDRHVIVVQQGTCKDYELYDGRRAADGSWSADSGAVFDLRRGTARPAGWTSADAAGLPILPGLAKPDEASSGTIRHALRFTAPRTRSAYVAPARHASGLSNDPSLPPMGLRIRLKRSYSLRHLHGQALAIAKALKRYGAILADNGSPFFVDGDRSAKWHVANLDELKRIPGRAFEAVKAGPATTYPASAQQG